MGDGVLVYQGARAYGEADLANEDDGEDTKGNDTNDEGAKVTLSSYDNTTYYCGRYIGNLPGSDGNCGPTDGPQCPSCKRYQQKVNGDVFCDQGHLCELIPAWCAGCCDRCNA